MLVLARKFVCWDAAALLLSHIMPVCVQDRMGVSCSRERDYVAVFSCEMSHEHYSWRSNGSCKEECQLGAQLYLKDSVGLDGACWHLLSLYYSLNEHLDS